MSGGVSGGLSGAHFHLKMGHHGVGNASLNTHLQAFDSPITVGEKNPHWRRFFDTLGIVLNF